MSVPWMRMTTYPLARFRLTPESPLDAPPVRPCAGCFWSVNPNTGTASTMIVPLT